MRSQLIKQGEFKSCPGPTSLASTDDDRRSGDMSRHLHHGVRGDRRAGAREPDPRRARAGSRPSRGGGRERGGPEGTSIASGRRPGSFAPRGRPPRRSPPPRRCWPSSARSCPRTMLTWPARWAGWPSSTSSARTSRRRERPGARRWTSCGSDWASPIGGSPMPAGRSKTSSAWPGWTGTSAPAWPRRTGSTERSWTCTEPASTPKPCLRRVRPWRSARRCWASATPTPPPA